MIQRKLARVWFPLSVLALASGVSAPLVAAIETAETGAMPGRLWLSQEGGGENPIHQREPRPNPAFPRAIMKLQQVAVGPDSQVFFASGLDGSIMHLLDGRHEIQAFEVPGQVRDLACSEEEHTVYFSVLPTPQDSEPLADGTIYRRDLWDGRATEVVTVRQADVGGNWWGTFTIRDHAVYVATLDNPSRIYRVTGEGAVREFEANTFPIQGLAAGPDGRFHFTSEGKVYRTADFDDVAPICSTERAWADVAVRP